MNAYYKFSYLSIYMSIKVIGSRLRAHVVPRWSNISTTLSDNYEQCKTW